MSTDHRLAKAAVFHLGTMWPRAIALDELVAEARKILGTVADSDTDVRAMCEILMTAHAAGLVELSTHISPFTLAVSDCPTASPVARFQAQRGDDFVATLRHASLHLEDPFARHLLCLLDGTRNRAALLREMKTFIAMRAADLAVGEGDGPRIPIAPTVTPEALEEKLAELGRLALLVA
jgi:hypothetical protein